MEGFKGELEQAGVPDVQKLVSPIIRPMACRPPTSVDRRLVHSISLVLSCDGRTWLRWLGLLQVVVLDDLADVVDKGVQIRSPWTGTQQHPSDLQSTVHSLASYHTDPRHAIVSVRPCLIQSWLSCVLGYLLRDLPPPWNVDALLHLQTLRGDLLPADKKKARAKLLEWYDGEVGPWSAGGGAASTSASRSAATSTFPSSATATAASSGRSGGSGWKSALASFKPDAPSPALPPQPHYQPPPSITSSAALLWNVRESPINPDVAGDALLWDVALSPAV